MKKYLNINVFESARSRMDLVFSEFDNIYVSFSGGKDSGVLVELALEAARKYRKLPLSVLYIDFEAQYKHTIDYVTRILSRDEIKPFWICLPIHLRNAVSQYQNHWLCWDNGKKDAWVRKMPKNCISDIEYFHFFRKGMEFEEFIFDFAKWYSKDKKTACIVGIRSDESLNRFRTIANDRKQTFSNLQWSTKLFPNSDKEIYNFYPIYDWRTEDIWRLNGKKGYDYNKIYDLMYMSGLSLHQMRLCQPYGDDQRKGLYLFKILEPETWAKIVNRVEGANFGNRYSETDRTTLGNYKVNLPKGHTYESYSKFLLDTMPPYLREHYQIKIDKFWKWWDKNGDGIMHDSADPKLEAKKKIPSWRRICKVLLKNDYYCKGLSFSQTKRELEKNLEIVKKWTSKL